MAEVTFRDYLNEIDELIERGSLDQATQHCRHILAQYPKAVEVYRLLGKTLLEQDEDRAAQDVFQRVLSVDPEDFVARVGLSIVHDRNHELEPAIWHMERAFEIAPSNALIQGELRRLYAQRDGNSPERIPLTRGALARMYAAGDLNTEAIADLRQLLAEQADRLDLQVQLAEVLWRDEQRVEAVEHTQQVAAALPYCLKANLILGAILRASGGNGESDEPLQRAQAVDPENEYAHRLFSGMGPLYRQSIMLDRLEVQTVEQMLEAPLPLAEAEEIPDWLRGLSDLEQPLLEEPESMHAARLTPGLHMPDVASEVPDWLQGLTGEGAAAAEAEVPDWLAALTGAAVAGVAAEALTEQKSEPEEVIVRPADEAVPDWITQLGQTGELAPTEGPPVQEEEPAWMAQLRETPPEPFSEQIPAAVDTETPDWLAQLQASEPTLEAETVSEKEPDWLAKLRASSEDVEPKEDEGLDFGTGKAAAGLAAAGIAFAATREEEVEPGPEPPIDFAPPAAVLVAESEEPTAVGVGAMEELEIFEETGAEPVVEATLGTAAAAAVVTALPEEGPTPPSQSAPAAVPEEMPSADDALAFLSRLAAGKEDQLRAQAEQEAEARMAEIMGRKPVEAAPAAEERPAPIKMTVPAATVAAVAAGLAAKSTKPEEKPAEPEIAAVPEEMPSADDALAFLSQLAAGKEDQLRAQAEQEAEVRMAAIMGRSAPLEPAPSIETTPASVVIASEAEAEIIEWPAAEESAEIAEPAAEAELPEWLKAMRPSEDAVAETPEGELPEWLRAMRPTEESSDVGLTALIEEEAAVEAAQMEEPPEWLGAQSAAATAFEEAAEEMEVAASPVAEAAAAFDQISAATEQAPLEFDEEPAGQGLAAGLAALELAAARAGEAQAAPPMAPASTSALLPLDWWTQSAADTGELVLDDLPEPYLSPRARAAEKEKAAAMAPATEAQPAQRKLPQTGPLRQTGPLGLPQTNPLGTPQPAAVSVDVEPLLSRVYQDEEDHAARLDLARTYWATGNREGAYTEYLTLVTAGEYSKEIMADLETIVEVHDQTDWHRMLGDAYMKAGRLSNALAQYRRALSEI